MGKGVRVRAHINKRQRKKPNTKLKKLHTLRISGSYSETVCHSVHFHVTQLIESVWNSSFLVCLPERLGFLK